MYFRNSLLKKMMVSVYLVKYYLLHNQKYKPLCFPSINSFKVFREVHCHKNQKKRKKRKTKTKQNKTGKTTQKKRCTKKKKVGNPDMWHSMQSSSNFKYQVKVNNVNSNGDTKNCKFWKRGPGLQRVKYMVFNITFGNLYEILVCKGLITWCSTLRNLYNVPLAMYMNY